MKFSKLSAVVLFSFLLIGCSESAYPEPDGSLRSRINGAAFGLTLEMGQNQRYQIEYKEELLSDERKDYIVKNVPNYAENRYLVQLESKTGIRLVDFKKGKTKIFYAPFDEKYTYIGSVLNSPNGKLIAMNLTQGFESPWSKLIIIDVKNNNYGIPLTDDALLSPSPDSGCSEVTLVEVRSEGNKVNPCIVEAPMSSYMIDWWSSYNKVELIKAYPSSIILYSLEVK